MLNRRINQSFMRNHLVLLLVPQLIFFLFPSICMADQFIGGAKYFLPENSINLTTPSVSSSATGSSTTFHAWKRYPAEEKMWLTMSDATAYGRDVLFGGMTLIRNATNGEVWTVNSVPPDGSAVITYGTITFYDNYNDYENCFVAKGGASEWIVYGTKHIDIT